MSSTPWRLLVFVLVCIALAATTTHVSNVPSQIQPVEHAFDAPLELALTHLGSALGVRSVTTLLVAALCTSALLCVALRNRLLACRWAGVSAALLAAALLTWIVVVLPAGREADRARATSPDVLRAVWPQLRDRWEYGHALTFGLQLCALGALTLSVMSAQRGLPRGAHRTAGTRSGCLGSTGPPRFAFVVRLPWRGCDNEIERS